ncbi:cell division protein YlmG/Ycf19 [Gracilibacillus boraciitolerans JCM 21714]|uniref:Cell division protein YlmG/Ycf19 n=1 Tax=Gracilibacillus boraciitolerans JCM 21714 TaxID=1298598 RepID=W4VFX1_9BACI|nr:YggT family protein [Gracilibacillus boraciitolerans]GAE91718.1 cell division protein YlmG/Ycf19 [Gracilibacillus boraciitolerans JCM 21714]
MSLIHQILAYAMTLYSYAIIIYILMSWFPGARESSFGRMLGSIVEPYLEPFRKIIPPIGGMIDISPIVAIIVLQMAMRGLDFLFRLI